MKKNNDVTVETVTVETQGEVVNVESQVGRKVDLNSKRAKRQLELEIKRELGLLKKGRPVNDDSERQRRINELNAKREAGTLKLGRPAYSEEEKLEADKVKKVKAAEEKEMFKAMAREVIEGKLTIEGIEVPKN